jgi:hypothetical protein
MSHAISDYEGVQTFGKCKDCSWWSTGDYVLTTHANFGCSEFDARD